jgi:hypothetical protein
MAAAVSRRVFVPETGTKLRTERDIGNGPLQQALTRCCRLAGRHSFISPQSLPPRGLCGKFVFRHISALSIVKSEIQLRHVHGLA